MHKMVVFSKKKVITGAERARTFGTNLKVDVERYKAYKNKEKERKRVQRKGQALSPSEVARRTKLNHETVRKYRKKDKKRRKQKTLPKTKMYHKLTKQLKPLERLLVRSAECIPKAPENERLWFSN